MPKASEVAAELRKIADALDQQPESILPRPELEFGCKYELGSADESKAAFLATAKVFPRPFKKGKQSYDDDALELRYTSDALIVTTNIQQSRVCKLIERERTIPAVYECEPILSAIEDAALTEA